MKKYTDWSRTEAPKYKVGDKVWLSTKNLKLNRPAPKLAERFLGPYEVVEIVSPSAIKLKLPVSWRKHPVVNVSEVRLWKKPTIEGQRAVPPAPVEVEGKQEFAVEAIIDARLKRGNLEFLVQWEGFTPDHNTWELASHVENAKEKVDRFYKKNPGAPRKLRKVRFEGLIFKPYTNYTSTPKGVVSHLKVEV